MLKKNFEQAQIAIDDGVPSTVQKKLLSDGDEAVITGDIHGSAHSIIRNLLRLMAMPNKKYIDRALRSPEKIKWLFMGDFGDRGRWGIEVWYIVMRLFLQNPGRVFLIRGNHEDEDMAATYGLQEELLAKYGDSEGTELFEELCDVFLLLPSAVYIGDGNDFIQVNHGGVPITQQGKLIYIGLGKFLSDSKQNMQEIVEVEGDHVADQLRWNDFIAGRKIKRSERGRTGNIDWCLQVGVDSAESAYQGTKVRNIFRGHEHYEFAVSTVYTQEGSDLVGGFQPGATFNIKNWYVYTFMSCPESHENLFRDGFGILKINGGYDTWTLSIYQYDLPDDRNGKLLQVSQDDDEGVIFHWATRP